MRTPEYDPAWSVCLECDGQGKFEDGQGQWWLCRLCGGYGSPAARIYGEKHPDILKPASVREQAIDFDTNKARRNGGFAGAQRDPFDYSKHATDFAVEWSEISAGPWADVLYSTAADRSS